MSIHFPDAPDRIKYAIDADLLTNGMWGDGVEAVCMMSAMVPGAREPEDCVTAGWPEWLTEVNVALFDQYGPEEPRDRKAFAVAVAHAVSRPVDHAKARREFETRVLKELLPYAGDSSDILRLAIEGDRSTALKIDAVNTLPKLRFDSPQYNAVEAVNIMLKGDVERMASRLHLVWSDEPTQTLRGHLVASLYEARIQ